MIHYPSKRFFRRVILPFRRVFSPSDGYYIPQKATLPLRMIHYPSKRYLPLQNDPTSLQKGNSSFIRIHYPSEGYFTPS